jgi:sodium transport system permease protein
VLLFFVFIPLQTWRLTAGLLLTEWGGLLGLTLLYARGTGLGVRATLRLRRPRPRALAGAALIGLSAWVVVGLLAEWILPVPKELVESLRKVVAPSDGSRGLASTILLMAVTPAVCEEALFRGPILRGFAARFRPVGAALLTGALFGLYHVDLWRLVPTGALGVLLSLIALESDSIVPAMLAHFTNNTCLILLAHFDADSKASSLRLPLQVSLFLTACTLLAAGALLMRRSARAREAG